MRLLDVNVLVDAFRDDAANHDTAFALVSAARASRERVVILPEVAVAFVRVVTHPRIFREPSSPAEALAALDAWTAAPSLVIQEAGRGRWEVFRRLLAGQDRAGNDVHDVLLAAAALDFDASVVTADRGFSRFEGLRVAYV